MTYHDPGVSYSTLSPSTCSNRKNVPAHSFGHGVSKEAARADLTRRGPLPGPGTYELGKGALRQSGPLVTPSLYSNTKWGTNNTPRTNLGLPRHKHTMPPGPGVYLRSHSAVNLTGSLQLYTSWRNATRAGWQDYCPRACQTPMVLSREHERERFGTHSPGPMTAAPVDSVGRQLNSTRKTQPRCAFGRSERFATAAIRTAAAVPGPGAYTF